MNEAAPIHSGLPSTEITLEYLDRLPKYLVEKPYQLALDVPLEDEADRTNVEFKRHSVKLLDIRSISDQIRLEHHGFQLLKLPFAWTPEPG